MTLKIDRESLPFPADRLAELVDAHRVALQEYEAHLRGVEEDAANDSLKPEDRRVAFPQPNAHPLIEAAVRAGGYELVGPSLEVRKQRLCAMVDQAEQEEIARIVAPRKRRYLDLLAMVDETAAARRKENQVRQDAVHRWAAKAHYDIDDLTEETVDAWKLEPFGG